MNEQPHNESANDRHARRERRRHRILQATAVLPSLCTTLNAISGFGAIHFAFKARLGQAMMDHGQSFDPAAAKYLMIASGLIFLAMFFDMLDGRLARMTRKTSEFGAQLDSLCDAVSFGVAPAVLMLQAVAPLFLYFRVEKEILGAGLSLDRLVWCVAAVYMSCAVLRLARFNVENSPDESAHMSFKGLPSPGAAAAVAALTMLYGSQEMLFASAETTPLLSADLLRGIAIMVLPTMTLFVGLLMVSRFRYPHIVNQYIRGKRSFMYLVQLVILLLVGLAWPIVTVATVIMVYVFLGPVGAIVRRVRRKTV